MAQWRIKEISDLTNISVRMLHHYDKIGLCKPSVRASNGYRWYSEQDLAKLQQIMALKFFGFSLGQIKTMLQQKPSILEHLLVQEQILKEQTEHLQQTQDALATVLQRCKSSKSLDWSDLIILIERYHMTEELKKTWVGKLSEDQQNRYIAFKQIYPKELDAWEKAIEMINSGKLGDPEGPDGQHVAKVFLKMSQAQAKWEAATKTTKKMTKADASDLLETIETFKIKGIPLSTEGNAWFARALVAHQLQCWEQLHKDITKNLDADSESETGKKLAKQWRELILNHCIGGGSKDFHFGVMLLMNAAQDKVKLEDHIVRTPTQTQRVAQNAKIMLDPMALSWIEKALRANGG